MNNPSPPRRLERRRSPLALPCVGFSVLTLILIALFVEIAIDSAALAGSAVTAANQANSQLQALTAATLPLRGVDKRFAATGKEIEAFYAQRIPARYSLIVKRLGELEVQSGVSLSHVGYSQGPPGPLLTEVSIDSTVTADYPQMMQFVNGLERDQTFFVIRSMTFQGQQDGRVNLQLRLSTWLRPANVTSGGLSAGHEEQAHVQLVNRR